MNKLITEYKIGIHIVDGKTKWYVCVETFTGVDEKYHLSTKYLHKNGKWFSSCGDPGFYDSVESAGESLRKYKISNGIEKLKDKMFML